MRQDTEQPAQTSNLSKYFCAKYILQFFIKIDPTNYRTFNVVIIEEEELMDPLVFFNVIVDNSDTSSESSDTEENIVGVLIEAAACTTLCLKKEKNIIQRSGTFVNVVVNNFTDKEFQQNFRVTREAFDYLHEKLEHKLKNFSYGPDTICPRTQILATIWILSTPDCYRSIGGRFDMAKATLYICFRRVIQALVDLGSTVIKWPSAEERVNISEEYFKWGKIPGVVAAIDGTYIPIKAPQMNPEVYVNRKCFHAITLQAICDNNRRFLDIYAGFPSSVSDIRIFKNSDIYKRICANPNEFFSENEFMIGDKAYPVLKWCIPPYIDRGNVLRKEANFNTQHAKTRQVIERSFALLFGRFRRLKYLDMSNTKLIPNVVLAACVLHNVCLMFNDNFIDIYEAEGVNNVAAEEVHENMHNDDLSRTEGIQRRNTIATALLPM